MRELCPECQGRRVSCPVLRLLLFSCVSLFWALDYLKQKEFKRALSSNEVITLRDLLLNSYVKPVGLNMIEEIKTGKKVYYKCILCGAHSDVDSMYNHVIGAKHTERYIDMRMEKRNIPFMTTKMREEYRDLIIKEEGLCIDDIKTITGEKYNPFLWERKRTKCRTLSCSSTPMSSMTNLTFSCSSLYEPESTTPPKSKSPEKDRLNAERSVLQARMRNRGLLERSDSQARNINKGRESNSLGRIPPAATLVQDSKNKKEFEDSIFKLADQIEFMFPKELEPTTLPKSKSLEKDRLDVERPNAQARIINKGLVERSDFQARRINKRMESNSLGRIPAAGALVQDSKNKNESQDSIFKLVDQIEFIYPKGESE
ncbi:uncharacterized protein [Penaeus vannamei]|uniref:uncharacterized protein isoform X1 n=1 Tax=Penaeus vannamei TaxID=6689 RepID=UPI00387F9E5C